MDTIFALASAPGKAGVAVIRVSGPQARNAAEILCDGQLPLRGMTFRSLKTAEGDILDQGMILTFEAPKSFTGEDVSELQVHGSNAVVSAVLGSLGRIDGLRLAEPGEFTRRALMNGRMDLAQVEGLADLIDAETEAQRTQAVKVMSGVFSKRAEDWRKDLIRAGALLEATIDFADEEVPVDVTPEVNELLGRVHDDLKVVSSGISTAERIRVGFEVAIVGRPNVGKSTLLNALAGREAAITSEFEGTTRDVIEVRMDFDGLPVTLMDTAGLRTTDDAVENIGISRAKDRARSADVRVFLVESDEDIDIEIMPDDIVLRSKVDLSSYKENGISGLSGEGVDSLVSRLTAKLKGRALKAELASRERHRVAIARAMNSLSSAMKFLDSGPSAYDIVAEELRDASQALGMLVGRIGVEDLLDEIFASFCLGK
ncbi:tRNA uridine-5-carboxymethylaminomethyl(34) synthesis GTPase MnmE [Sulfitobacter sp. BDSS02]|nr:tRNA uridine-5-carboxymethylaminomethyl(34) synthesis GTPase MnmE [Sulfitobacter sp. BDSS02]MBR9848699.1 tRNA uridine-5-carboxymethylaminomethyl(34) synthesis GTPase MnmE [Paracoccaceae bacterium]